MTELTAKGKEQEMILAYLKDNASDALAAKINNGTPIIKDGKQLINRKSLDGFMTYASEEARKQAENNARCACVQDVTVYGWAVHYFEEDGIAGTLYNSDGTEYKPKITATSTPVAVKQQPKSQPSLFDLMQPDKPEIKAVTDEQDVDDEEPLSEDEQTDNAEVRETTAETPAPPQPEKPQPGPAALPFYRRYTELKHKYPDSVILYRLGDFYEVFGDDAVDLANDFEITLTSRDCGLTERVPVLGIPYHAADTYFGKFIGRGYKLAVVEHLDEPRLIGKEETEQDYIDAIDPETGQVLTEAEMRLFDGDVEEPKEIPEHEDVKAKSPVNVAFDTQALQRFERVLGNIYVLR